VREYDNYVAEATLKVQEGAFFDLWVFNWNGELVRATISKVTNTVTVLTDHRLTALEEIHNFIQQIIERLTGAEENDFESGD
jgi:hypothetical protein